jgi:FAD/FMN-containing dehydrogenase
MAGGAVGDGVVLDLSRLSTLSPVDNTARTVWAGAGVLRRQVEHAANAVGLRFPVDPSSGTFATIGGMTATNAAGPRTLAHGAMRRWVEAVDCIFADGSHATIRRGAPLPPGVAALDRWLDARDAMRRDAAALPPSAVRKESSGYGVHDYAASGDLVDLLVGSEGTLALGACSCAWLRSPRDGELLSVGRRSTSRPRCGLARTAGASACELLDRNLDVAHGGPPRA